MIFLSLHKKSIIHKIDPRVRIVASLLLAVSLAFCTNHLSLWLALSAALVFVGAARLSLRQTARRLAELNFFMLFIIVFFPFSVDGSELLRWGSFIYSREGLLKALLIALKANSIMIAVTGLVGTMEPTTLGQALRLLGISQKLIHILLFMVRYLDIIGDEYLRLKNAMKLRAFQPRLSLHTFQTYGNMIGMVLVRSLERSERILVAMKCRGFNGTYYCHTSFRFCLVDLYFILLLLPLMACLLWLEVLI